MKNYIRMIYIVLSIIVSIAILAEPLEAFAGDTCAYYSKYSGYCPKNVVSGGKYCKDHTCAEQGCYKLNKGGANSRCDSCQKKYLYNSGITSSDCKLDTCSKPKASGSFYCSSHTCAKSSCSYKVISGSKYCSSHTCQKGRFGCYNEVSGANEKCKSCKKGTTTSSSSSKKKTTSSSTSKKKTSSKKKTNMPDCDDYDSYDDFMDDWDGCMPDGSDAEDYWENW